MNALLVFTLLASPVPALAPENILCTIRSAEVAHADGRREPLQLLSPWGDGEELDLQDPRLWQQCQRGPQG